MITSSTVSKYFKDTVLYERGKGLASLDIRLDNQINKTYITRANWWDAVGNIGGVQGFVCSLIGIILWNFTEVDFLTTMIKGLFL